jgi:hypothetical protein
MIKEQVGIIEYYFGNAILVMLSSFQQQFSPKHDHPPIADPHRPKAQGIPLS